MNQLRLPSPATTFVIFAVTLAILFIPFERSDGNVTGTLNFFVGFMTFVGIYGIITLGLNIQWGYTGVFNFGILAFFLIGAYTAAIITKEPATGEFQDYIGGYRNDLDFIPYLDSGEWFPFIVGTVAAGTVAGLLALFLSIPTLRLREDYLAIATIGVAEFVRRITIEERDLVNGTRGLTGVPQPFGGWFDSSDWKYVNMVIALTVLILLYFALERAVRSPWGRVLLGLREDEEATEASGKNVFAFKTQSFVVGAVIMGFGGAIWAYTSKAITPDSFTHYTATFLFWAMLILGGSGNNKGAIVGAYVLWGFWVITLLMTSYDLGSAIQTRLPYLRELGIGLLIVITLLLRPAGLLPQERRVSIWVERYVKKLKRNEPPPAAEPALPDG